MKAMMTMIVAAVAMMVAAGCSTPPPVLQADPVRARLDAEVVLKTALDSPEWSTRARAIEALAYVDGAAAGRMFTQALGDREPAVRFAAAVAIGDTAYSPAKDRLAEMASADPARGEGDRRVYAGVLYALWRLTGETSYAFELATLLKDSEWPVRDNAAFVLGRMDVKGVTELLTMQLRVEQQRQAEVEMRLVESLAQLGDTRSRELLLAFTQTRKYEGQDLQAINALGKVGGPHAQRQLRVLTEDDRPAYLRLAAVAALADLGVYDEGAYHYATLAMTDTNRVVAEKRKDKTVTPDEANAVRYLAVLALGRMNQPLAVDAILPALKSESGPLRVAAAMSVLQLLPPESPAADEAANPSNAATDDTADDTADCPMRSSAHNAMEPADADDDADDDTDDDDADDEDEEEDAPVRAERIQLDTAGAID